MIKSFTFDVEDLQKILKEYFIKRGVIKEDSQVYSMGGSLYNVKDNMSITFTDAPIEE